MAAVSNLAKRFLLKLLTSTIDVVIGTLHPILVGVIAASALASFILIAPNFHQGYIRKYVGSNVYFVSPTGFGGGTAFTVIAASGKTYLLTNDHICAGSNSGSVMVWSETSVPVWYPIIERSQTTDLCLVQAPMYSIGLDLASGTYFGDRVQAVGHPKLMQLTLSNIGEIIQIGPITLSDGVDSKSNVQDLPHFASSKCDTANPKFKLVKTPQGMLCTIDLPSVYFTNVFIQPGNSGSPMVNFMGDVVGVASGVSPFGWAYAVSLDEVKAFLSNK